MIWAILYSGLCFSILIPFMIPMPKWRERQLERKKPMNRRVIDIDIEVTGYDKQRVQVRELRERV
jgi:hypothetical protein